MVSISLSMPGHQTMLLASASILEIPGCLLCSCWSTCSWPSFDTITLFPLNKHPFCMDSSSRHWVSEPISVATCRRRLHVVLLLSYQEKSGLWSEQLVNFPPKRYPWNFLTPNMIASPSLSKSALLLSRRSD